MSKGQYRARIPQVALLLETSTEYGRGLLRGILRYSRLHGPWSLHVAPGHFEQVLPKVESWRGNGIIARIQSPEMERLVRSMHLPFVASSLSESGRPAARDKLGEIRTDSAAIAKLAVSYFIETGFRHLAFCGFPNCHWSTVREKVFVGLGRDSGRDCSVHYLTLDNWMQRPDWIRSWQREQPMLVKWLETLPKPVGLMACNDACGREVLQACRTAGLRVPDDVAVLGVDNDEMMCELSSPPLSSVALDLERAGYEAARLLEGLMNRQPPPRRVVWVEPTHVMTRLSSDVIAQKDKLVAEALRFIRDHAREPISVSDITNEISVSRRTLERRFLRAMGRPVLSEIMRCHLQRAKQLLVESDLQCCEIAVEAGFGSLKTFNRTFSRREGMTPQAFRRHFQRSDIRPSRKSLPLLNGSDAGVRSNASL
ncbi:MAG: XylR family transcriptional regulator [Acidobacteriota bacterium]